MSSRPTPDTEATVDLRQYIAVVRRNRRLIAAITVGCLLLAGIYSFIRTPIYTAKAKILLMPTLVNLTGPVDLEKSIDTNTEREIALSSSVAVLARKELGIEKSVQDLLAQVTVEAPEDSRTLEIAYSDPDPVAARNGADAFADAYLKYKRDQALADIQAQIEPLEEQISLNKTDISELKEELGSLRPGSLAYSQAVADRDELEAENLLLNTQIAGLRALNTEGGTKIGIPAVPVSPSSPNHPVDLGLGLFLGLFLGVGLAFFRTRADARLHERLELEQVVGAPVLAVVPKDIEWTHRSAPRLVTVQDPRAPTAEAFRTLRPTLLVSAAQQNVRVIIVASPTAGEGKTTTAANLGVVMAQADRRTMILSADLRKPRVHEFFGLPNERGLSDVLAGRLGAMDALRRSGVENLWLMPSGPIPAQPAEQLQSMAMKELLAEQRGLVDFILLDCPPILAVADTLGLAAYADGVLLVANAGSTTIDAAEQARERLHQVGAKVLGCVLNDLDLSTTSSYYGYGYGEDVALPENGKKRREVLPRRGQTSS
jgi:non-specific protein-tyrosine kinase